MSEPIAACATPWGHAAIAVVRLTGADLAPVLLRVCDGLPRAWGVRRTRLRDATGVFDEGLLSWFPAPRSYTGEDVAEVSCHGNPLIVERLLDAFGVRRARPGEFTRRAFLHGKLDLARAEAVLQAIEATSRRGLEVAQAGLAGAIGAAAEAMASDVTDVAAELEAILDYPGEDLLFEPDEVLIGRLETVAATARAHAASFRSGRFAVEGARVALVGPPNAGKSSLFNALLGRERAIVSPVPGTTRDVVEATLQLDALRIVLMDTAGERETADAIEAEGVLRASAAQEEADLVIRCVPLHEAGPIPDGELLVGTFADLPAARQLPIRVSARSGEGLDALRNEICARLVGEEPGGAGLVLASARQRDLLMTAVGHLEAAAAALPVEGPAVAAEQLYAAIEAFGAVSGRDAREGVLDRLFARFCVGK